MNLMEAIPWKGQSDTSKKLTIIAKKIISATSEILNMYFKTSLGIALESDSLPDVSLWKKVNEKQTTGPNM